MVIVDTAIVKAIRHAELVRFDTSLDHRAHHGNTCHLNAMFSQPITGFIRHCIFSVHSDHIVHLEVVA